MDVSQNYNMAYTRFTKDSDTYTMAAMAGFMCVGCLLAPKNILRGTELDSHESQSFVTLRELVEHLLLHMKHGHKVPRKELKRLYRDIKKSKEEENDINFLS